MGQRSESQGSLWAKSQGSEWRKKKRKGLMGVTLACHALSWSHQPTTPVCQHFYAPHSSLSLIYCTLQTSPCPFELMERFLRAKDGSFLNIITSKGSLFFSFEGGGGKSPTHLTSLCLHQCSYFPEHLNSPCPPPSNQFSTSRLRTAI